MKAYAILVWDYIDENQNLVNPRLHIEDSSNIFRSDYNITISQIEHKHRLYETYYLNYHVIQLGN